MDLFGLIGTQELTILGDAAKSELFQNLIVYSIMWRFIKKTVETHFSKIEVSLDRIAKVLEKHGERLDNLEQKLK